MSRAPGGRLSPWIESLILSYGAQAEQDGGGGGGGAWLKAHVTRVGQMSASQAQSADGPSGLLFLSDGAVEMPAVLTAAAWERLQEQEERECFTSLLNTTVRIRDSQLLFHMAPEQTRCRFYLSVSELATTAAGPVKDNLPCCTTLPAVRAKICGTWRALLGRDDSQPSQRGLDLSELLGAWRHDCLQAVLDGVHQSLAAAGERPSTSTATPQGRLTGWEQDRARYKTEEPFSVPVGRLLVPQDDVPPSGDEAEWRIHEPPTTGRVCDLDWSQGVCDRSESQGVCDRSESQGVCDRSESPALQVGDDTLRVLVIAGAGVTECPPSNPWDMFPPPCVSSQSSPDSTPPPPTDATAAESRPGPSESRPSPTQSRPGPSESRPGPTQSRPGPSESRPGPTQSRPGPSESIPGPTQSRPSPSESRPGPTQSRPGPSESGPDPTDSRPGRSKSRPCPTQSRPGPSKSRPGPSESRPGPTQSRPDPSKSGPDPAAAPTGTLLLGSKASSFFPPYQKPLAALTAASSTSETPPASDGQQGAPERPSRKRKQSEDSAEVLASLQEEGEEPSGSPPSWLFTSEGGGPGPDGDSSFTQTTTGNTPTMPGTHSDGTPFSYSYTPTGQDLQDLSRLSVTRSLLHWAVKYLVAPKRAGGRHDAH